MTLLQGLHGTIAILLICSVLYVEEAGVPLPLVPGDALLIVAGVFIANGSISPWIFVPAALVSVLGGALTAYTWSRTLGATAVGEVAQRFHAQKPVERAFKQLRTAGPVRIAVVRLIPGLRIYTAIVSGAAGVDLRVFLLGVIPAVVVWLFFFTALGVLVGVPALTSLSHVQHLAVTGAGLLAIGVVTLFGVRHIPHGDTVTPAWFGAPRWLLLVVSIILDLTVAISIVSGFTEMLRDGFGLDDPDGIIDLALITGAVVLLYVGVARRVIGATVGERLLGVRYVSH
jgi:membrane-associated protein